MRVSIFLVLWAIAMAGPADRASAKFDPEREIFNCTEAREPNSTICKSPHLQQALSDIERRYFELRHSPDPDVRYLVPWDRYYFGLKIWNCRNAPQQLPEISDCISAAIQAKRSFLDGAVTSTPLLEEIAASGSFDAGLVDRYPAALSGRSGSFCGSVKVHVRRGRLAGTFEDCRTDRIYPLEFETITESDLSFFSGQPAIRSWFRGRFERRGKTVVFVAQPWTAGSRE